MNVEINTDLQKEIVQELNASEKPAGEPENNKSSKIKTTIDATIVIAIFNAYVYFAGYAYFKSKMLSLGFDSAKIDGDIGFVYIYAYECFGYIVRDGILPLLESIGFYSFVKFWPISIAAIGFTAIYLAFIDNKKFKSYFSKKFKSTGKKSAIAAISILIPITGIGAFVVFSYLFLMLILTFFLYLSIPILLGGSAANEEIMNFTCEIPNFLDEKKAKNMKQLGCTTVVLKDKISITGSIYYADDTNIYMLIEGEQSAPDKATPMTRTVPIDQIQERSQKIYINQNRLKEMKVKS